MKTFIFTIFCSATGENKELPVTSLDKGSAIEKAKSLMDISGGDYLKSVRESASEPVFKLTVQNYSDGSAFVGYVESGKGVDVVKCHDYHMGNERTFYRVDHRGITVDSIIRKKSEAISSARKYIKNHSELFQIPNSTNNPA